LLQKNDEYWRSLWKLLLILGLVVVLFWQAYNPAWSTHLFGDVFVHHQQVIQYTQENSWGNISFKDYQPGALLFFMVPHWLTSAQGNYEFYRAATLFVNGLLLLLHAWIFHRWGPKGANWLLGGMLLAMGPLLLYRFDLMVSLLVLGAWLLATKKYWRWSGILMGLAVATKLYPIVLLPILLVERWRSKKMVGVIEYVAYFCLGIAIVTAPFLMLGGSLTDITDSLNTFKMKPVEFQSLWANVIAVRWMLGGGEQLVIDEGQSVHGFAIESALLPLQFYNLLWIVLTGSVLIFLLWRWRRRSYLHPIIPIIMLTVFTLLSRVLNPQYLWWFLAFLPLLNLKEWPVRLRWNLITAMIASLLLTQIIYPLRYNELLNWYFGNSDDAGMFVLLLIRNGLLVVWLCMLIAGAERIRVKSLT